jgi:hypothetical protein
MDARFTEIARQQRQIIQQHENGLCEDRAVLAEYYRVMGVSQMTVEQAVRMVETTDRGSDQRKYALGVRDRLLSVAKHNEAIELIERGIRSLEGGES